MANLDFLSVLAGLDVEQSTENIQKQLGNVQKQLKDFKVSLNVDPAQLKSAMAKIQPEMMGPQMQDKEALKAASLQSAMLDAVKDKYKDLDYAITKFSVDTNRGMATANIEVQNLDKTISKTQATVIDYGDAISTVFGTSGVATGYADATERLTKDLGRQALETEKLISIQRQRALTTEEEVRLDTMQSAAKAKVEGHINRLGNALDKGFISQSKYNELLGDTTLALGTFNQKVELSQEKLQNQNAIDAATSALRKYKAAAEEIKQIEIRMGTTELSESQGNRMIEDLKNQQLIYRSTIAQSQSVQERFTAWEQTELATRAKNKAKQIELQEQAELASLVKLKKAAIKYEEEKETFKRSSKVTGADDPVVKLARERYKAAETEFNNMYEAMDKGLTLPKSKQALAEIKADFEAMLDNIEKKGAAIDQQREHNIKTTFFSPDSRVDPSTYKVFTDEDGSKFTPENLLRDQEAMRQFTFALGGGETQMKKNVTTVEKYGQKLQQVTLTHDIHAKHVRDVTYTYNEAEKVWHRNSEAVRLNANRMLGWGEMLSLTVKRMVTWVSMGQLVYGVLQKMQEGLKWVVDMNKELVQSAIIQRTSMASATKQIQNYVALGKEMSMPAIEIAKATVELQRQGLALEEAEARMKTILKLSSTGMTTVAQSMQTVTAAVEAMKVSHTRAADVILKASQISAADVEGIGEALSKTASSAYAAGLSIEQTSGIMSGLIQVTQEGSSTIGNSLKTILARFNTVNEETGGYNEDLNKIHEALKSIGVEYLTADGQIRNTYDVLKDTSEIWDTLTKNQQAYVATVGAGVRMQSRFYSIMQNFDLIDTFTNDLNDAEGSLDDAFSTQLEGLEAQLNQLQLTWEEFWSKAFPTETIVSGIQIIQGFLKTITALVDAMGGFNTLLMGILTYGTFKMKGFADAKAIALEATTFKEFGKGLLNMSTASRTAIKGLTAIGNNITTIKNNAKTANINLKTLTTGFLEAGTAGRKAQFNYLATQLQTLGTGTKVATAGVTGLSTALKGVAMAAKPLMLFLGTMAINLVAANLIMGALNWASEFFTGAKAAEKMTEELDYAVTELERLRVASQNVGDTYSEWVELTAKTSLTADETARLTEVMNELGDLAPNLVTGYDEFGNSILDANTSLETLNESLALQKDLMNYDYMRNFGGKYKELSKTFNEQAEELKQAEEAFNMLKSGNGRLSGKQADILGLNEVNSQGVLNKVGLTYFTNVTDSMESQIVLQQAQARLRTIEQKQLTETNNIWRQTQPIISAIGKESGLSAQGLKALRLAVKGINLSDVKNYDDLQDKIRNLSTTVAANASDFERIFDAYDDAKDVFSDTGDITAFNETIGNLRVELSGLIETLGMDVNADSILSALDSIAEKESSITSLIDRLETLRGRLDNSKAYFDALDAAREEYNDTGQLSLNTLMDAVESSDGMLDMESLLGMNHNSRMAELDAVVAKLYESIEAEKEHQLVQIQSAKKAEQLRKQNAKAGTVAGDSIIRETEKRIKELEHEEALLKQEAQLARESFMLENDPLTRTGEQFDFITGKIKDYKKYLQELGEEQGLTGASMEEIIEKHPELIMYLGDEIALRDHLLDLVKQDEKTQLQALARKLEATESFYKQNVSVYNALMKDLANKYKLDLDNFRTVQQAKYGIAAAVGNSIGKINGQTISSSYKEAQRQLDMLKQTTKASPLAAISPNVKAGANAKVAEMETYVNTLKAMEKTSEDFAAGIDLSKFTAPSEGKDKKSGSQQFRELMYILPRYAAKLDDLANSYDKATTAHEKLFRRLEGDQFFAEQHSEEYFIGQAAKLNELYSLQGKAIAQQSEIAKVQKTAYDAFKKTTGLQADAANTEAAFLNWKQAKEMAIHKLTQDQKFISSDATKNAYAERVKAIQHEIALAEYHRSAWDKATDQLASLNDQWWEFFSTMQSTMQDLTDKTITNLEKYQTVMMKAIADSRGIFGRYDRKDDLHDLNLLTLELKKLQKQFVATSGSFNANKMGTAIKNVNKDTKALLATVDALNEERLRLEKDTTMSEVDKQEQLNEIIKQQVELEKELNAETEAIMSKLYEMELQHREIENAMEHRIELKQDELDALQKQKQLEEKIRQEQERQLELLKIMDDTRFSYITALGEEVFTYDRSKFKDLESKTTQDDAAEQKLQEEIDLMQKQLDEYKEANRIQEETLKILGSINDSITSTITSDIDATITALEGAFDKMVEKLTYNIGVISDKWFDAQAAKDAKTARDILAVYNSMDSLMKALFNKSLPGLQNVKTFDTGGFTGRWGSEGKLAVLHEKELVLDKSDTEKLLAAVQYLKGYDVTELAGRAITNTPTAISNSSKDTNVYLNNCKFITENVKNFGKELQNIARGTIVSLG